MRIGGIPGKGAVTDTVEDGWGHERSVEEGCSALFLRRGGGRSCHVVSLWRCGGHDECRCGAVIVVQMNRPRVNSKAPYTLLT